MLEIRCETPLGLPRAELQTALQHLAEWLPEVARTISTPATSPDVQLVEWLGRLVLHLQREAKSPVHAFELRSWSSPGKVLVVVEFQEERLVRECLNVAEDICLAALEDRPFNWDGEQARLAEFADEVCIGSSTRAIVSAAQRRGIPVRRLGGYNLFQLGHGCRQRRIWTAETDQTSSIAKRIARDKAETKSLLRSVGIPVAEGRLVGSPEEAWEAAQELGVPVVVKPLDANRARGVSVNLRRREAIENAYGEAQNVGSAVLVERYAVGYEHRLLVVGERVVAATRAEATWVTGDGVHTIRELIETQVNSDPSRTTLDSTPNCLVTFNASNLALLAQAGLTPESVPAAGEPVQVDATGYYAEDVTDQVHPEVAAQAVLAAKMVGLDIAGLDVIAADISRPLAEQGGIVCEVNAGPGLLMHVAPPRGRPQPVGEAIVDWLFPAGATGCIPIIGVVGEAAWGARFAQQLHAELLAAGYRAGLASPAGVWLQDRQIREAQPAVSPAIADLLLQTTSEVAVFALEPEDIQRHGMPIDRFLVGVIQRPAGADAPAADVGAACPRAIESLFADAVVPEGRLFATAGASDDRTLIAPILQLVAQSQHRTAAVGTKCRCGCEAHSSEVIAPHKNS